jgi:hypothetical protein
MAVYEEKTKPATLSKQPKLFPGDDDTKTLGWLQQRWLEMDGARDDTKWELRHDQEEAEISWNEDGTANVNLPIERSQARLKEADENAQKPIIKFIPTEPDDVEKVELTEEVWDHVWKEANTDENLAVARQGKRIFGTAVWKEFIKEEIETKWEIKKETGSGRLTSDSKTIKRSWIQGKMIDIRNFWIDPVHNQDDAVDCFEAEVDVSREKLENLRNNPNYKNIDEALKAEPLSEEVRSRVFFTREEEYTTVPLKNPKYTLWHYYNKEKGVYVVSVNLQVTIREGVNPCPTGGLPYIILVDEPKYMSLYGRGMHEQLESAKYELNVTTNQIIDLIRESSTNTLLLGENAAIEDAEIVNGIGRVLNITGGDEFQWSTPPASDKGLFNLRNALQQDSSMITGIDAYSVQGDQARTLGQEEIREINRLKSLSITIQSYNYFLVRMARLRLAYIQFYVTETTGRKIVGNKRMIPIQNKKIKVTRGANAEGELEDRGITFEEKEGYFDFLELTPKMIRSSMDITVETPLTSTTLNSIRKQRRQEIFEAAIQAAQLNPEMAQKLTKFFEASLHEQMEDSGSNPDKFFEKEEGVNKEELRKNLLGDLPQPPKPFNQPQRNNRDELAQVSGMNLERESNLETQ